MTFLQKLVEAKLVTQQWIDFSHAFKQFSDIATAIKGTAYYPSAPDIFKAFNETPSPQEVKVVILGQDPYHDGNATGLAFDNKYNKKQSPSLRNILHEIILNNDDNYGEILEARCDVYTSHLKHLPEQGVLLLNTALTVEAGKAGSHTKLWEPFTNEIITDLNKVDDIIWMLWGKHAQSYKHLITNPTHTILEAGHPSPLNRTNPFIGCNHFSIANDILKSKNKTEIKW